MKAFYLAVMCVLGLAQADVKDHFDCLSGVPAGSMEDEAQVGPKPFRIDLPDITGPITPGASHTVTIWGNRPFSGFFLRAQYLSGKVIGQWLAEGNGLVLGQCEGPIDVLYTIDGAFGENGTNTVSATWVAPDTFSLPRIEFVATVIDSDGFWLNILNNIQVSEESFVLPGEPPVQTAPSDHQPAAATGGATDAQAPPPDVIHDSRREDELEAAWQEKRAQMIDNEEANSEGSFNRVELLEREAHEKEIHEEQMAYEREQEERERIRMERLRAEIRDKEEYDRQKAEQEDRLEEERLRELEYEMERQRILAEERERIRDLEKMQEEEEAIKGKATAGASCVSVSVASILMILTAMFL